MITTPGQVSELKSTMIASRYGIIIICTPSQLPLGGVGPWVKMTDIAHPVITMANSTSETWYQLANDASDDHVVLYSSEIHGVLAEISQYDIAICLNWAIRTRW